jgi:enoyl-CoA hydratase
MRKTMTDIVAQQDGDVLRITINRPETGNKVSDEMAAELTRLIHGAAETSRLIVLRGAGDDFCAGRDSGKRPATQPEALDRRRKTEVIFDCYGAFRRSPIPIVAVVQGKALGFGCGMAALADVTIAGDGATFQIPEMGHNTMPTMLLSSLVDRVPRKALTYMTYTTNVIDATRALTWGIVSDVVPAAQLDATAESVCRRILSCPAPATEAVKEYMRRAPEMAIEGAVDFARNLHATINSSSEMRRRS